MTTTWVISVLLLIVGSLFFAAGTVGLLRFPDVHARLHALTKADNVGLGFIAAGVFIHTPSFWMGAKLLLVWLLVLYAGSLVSYLIAHAAYHDHRARRKGEAP